MGEIQSVVINNGSSIKKPTETRDEASFSIKQKTSTILKNSNILNGKVDSFDYIKAEYIDNVSIKKTTGIVKKNSSDNDNDWTIVLSDGANLKYLLGYDKAVTGLRIFVDGTNMRIIGLKEPIIGTWDVVEENVVADKLRIEKDVSYDPVSNTEPIYDSSEPDKHDKFIHFVKLVKSFGAHDTTSQSAFRGLIRELFFNLEAEIKDTKDFEKKKKLLMNYVQIYSSIEKALYDQNQTDPTEEAKVLVYGKSPAPDSKPIDGMSSLINEFTENMKSQLSVKFKKGKISNSNEALKELADFLKDLQSKLNKDGHENINKEHAKLFLDLIKDSAGLASADLTSFNDRVVKLLDSKEQSFSIKDLVKDIKFEALKNPAKFEEEKDTKSLSDLLGKLNLEPKSINDSNTRVFSLKGGLGLAKVSSYVIVESSPDKNFNLTLVDIFKGGTVKTLNYKNQSYKETKDLLDKAVNLNLNELELNSQQKLAVVEFCKSRPELSEYVKTAGTAYLAGFNGKAIDSENEFQLFTTLIKDLSGQVEDEVLNSIFSVDQSKIDEMMKLNDSLALIQKYISNPNDMVGNYKKFSESTDDGLKQWAVTLPKAKEQLLTIHQENIESKFTEYVSNRDKIAKELIANMMLRFLQINKANPGEVSDKAEIKLKTKLGIIFGKIGINDSESIQDRIVKFLKREDSQKIAQSELVGAITKEFDTLLTPLKGKADFSKFPAIQESDQSELRSAFTAILTDSKVNKNDSLYVRDFIALLKADSKLNKSQIDWFKNILEKYNFLGNTKLGKAAKSDDDFLTVINEFKTNISNDDYLAWGFNADDFAIEAIISELMNDTNFDKNNLKITAMEAKQFIGTDENANRESLEIQGLADLEKKINEKARAADIELDKPKRSEIVFRFLLRNSVKQSPDFVTFNLTTHTIPRPVAGFSFGKFVDRLNKERESIAKLKQQKVEKEPELMMQFRDYTSRFSHSVDKLDALRKYDFAMYLAELPLDKSLFRNLKPDAQDYQTQLRKAAEIIQVSYKQRQFAGFQRVLADGTTPTKTILEVQKNDIQKLVDEMIIKVVTDGQGMITHITLANSEKVLKLLQAIGLKVNGKPIKTEQDLVDTLAIHRNIRVDGKDGIDYLNLKPGNKQGELLASSRLIEIITKVTNNQLKKYNEIDSVSDSNKRKEIFEKVSLLENLIGKDKLTKSLAEYETVSVEEIMFSIASMIKDAADFEAEERRKKPVGEANDEPTFEFGGANAVIYSPQLLDYFNHDLEEVNKAFKKKKEKKDLSLFSTNRSIA